MGHSLADRRRLDVFNMRCSSIGNSGSGTDPPLGAVLDPMAALCQHRPAPVLDPMAAPISGTDSLVPGSRMAIV